MATISDLIPQVQSRLEEFAGPVGDGEWWSIRFELRTALIEAMNDLLVLIGRPTQAVNQQLTLTPNTPWQSTPVGIIMITDIYGATGQLRCVSLHDLDYVQSSWNPAWEQDIDGPYGPVRWAPIGFNLFVVHPAPSVPTNVTFSGIAYPTTAAYPYTGAEPVIFHDEVFAALEAYAALYARLKEGGQDMQQAMTLYREYLTVAQRLTTIEDRRDPFIFSPSFGAGSGLDSLTKR